MDIILKKVRLENYEDLVDVAINDGKIVKIEKDIKESASKEIEANGKVLIPGLIEAHLHLDKALIADRKPNKSGTLKEAIEVTGELKPTFTNEDIEKRAKATLDMLIKHGVTYVRTQSEFDPSGGFGGFETIMKLKEEYKDVIDIQVAAFPQEGIIKAPGTLDMMHKAMEMGADAVGGIPYNDTDANEHIDIVFELAKKYNKPVDLHQDFMDDYEGSSIEYLCEKTIKEGFEGKVSVGHLTSLGALPKDKLDKVIKEMAKAKINVFSLPATDLHLGGRNDEYNVRRGLTPIRALRDGGVNVGIATNNIRNPFTPYGNGDIIQTAMLAIPTAHLGGADDLSTVLNMITKNPAKALGIEDYGIKVGNPANMVLLDTEEIDKAIIDLPVRLYVIKDGKVTVETTKEVKIFY